MIYKHFNLSFWENFVLRPSLRKLSSSMSLNSENVKELQIKTPYGFIAAKCWNETGQKIPILALHGWMDNAGTWDRVCPLLDKNHPVVAIDVPGHGLSSLPPIGMGFYFTDNLVTIHRVLQYLQWKQVILLGHSMGGGSAILYAGTMPEKVYKLIVIDLFKPIHIDAEDQPERTAQSLVGVLKAEEKLPSEPPKYDYVEIVKKMVTSYGQNLTEDSAKILLKRGARKHEDGKYSFTHSSTLRVRNTTSMTFEQQKAFASNIVCDFLLIKARTSPTFTSKEAVKNILQVYKKNSKNFILEVVEGTHHVHLTDPEPVAKLINAFLHELPQSEVNKKQADDYVSSML